MKVFTKLFRKRPQKQLNAAVQAAVDFGDPAERVGAELYVILGPQLKLLTSEAGYTADDNRLRSQKCRGAVLGTALFVSVSNFGRSNAQATLDTVAAAFVLVYGQSDGLRLGRETFESVSHDDAVSATSDWAYKDTEITRKPGSVTTPSAFYLAAIGMI